MSAWVCSKAHIDAMVTAAIALGGGGHGPERYGYVYHDNAKIDLNPASADVVGQMLRDTIVEGVSHRYPGDDVSKGELPGPGGGSRVWYLQPYKFEKTRTLADGEIVALISAYEYQACEHNDWMNTFGWKFCESVKHRLLKRVESAFTAEGGSVEWGYEEVDVFPDTKQWAVSFRAVEFPQHLQPLMLIPARNPKDALLYADMWYGDYAMVFDARQWDGGDSLTAEAVEAEVKRNAEWIAEQTPDKPAEPAPEPVRFKAPEGIPAELAAILNRAAQSDDEKPLRNS